MQRWLWQCKLKNFKDTKTMIILITGASHTGKTALAQKLLEKYKYPYLSIDHLKDMDICIFQEVFVQGLFFLCEMHLLLK